MKSAILIVILYITIDCTCYASCRTSTTCPMTVCPAGEWAGMISGNCLCFLCTAGNYCPNTNICGCPGGTYNPLTGSSSLSSCLNCNPGYYCPYPSSIQSICPENYYNPTTGSPDYTSCISCPNNTASIAGSTSISACTSTVLCSINTYSSTGKEPCTNCPSGYTSPIGSTECTAPVAADCTVGTWSSTGKVPCSSCQRDTYSSNNGATSCTACPSGTFNPNTGSSSSSDCVQSSDAVSISIGAMAIIPILIELL